MGSNIYHNMPKSRVNWQLHFDLLIYFYSGDIGGVCFNDGVVGVAVCV